MLGHFQGLPLSGAEARLNERSDGRLERLLLTNLYPQRLGETVVLEPVDEAPPQGAVILGLGPSDELDATQLRGIVTRALVRVALNVLDQRLVGDDDDDADAEPLGVSAVVIGSSAGGGLTVEASVRALIDGTLGANASLRHLDVGLPDRLRPATELVRYHTLEVIERYEDRVDLVVAVLAKLQALDDRQRVHDPDEHETFGDRHRAVEFELEPRRGEGWASANPPIDASAEVWRRVDIRSIDTDDPAIVELEFTAIGRLARAERVVGTVERTVVDRVVGAAIHNSSDDAVGGALFELLIPQELKGDIGSGENLQLLVGENEADLPWELLRPRPQDHEQQVPLALRVGLLRQFRESDELRFAARRPSGNNLLVIGNPPSPDLPTLSGAADEARAVASQFSSGISEAAGVADEAWAVRSYVWPSEANSSTQTSDAPKPEEALYDLLNGDWRVIHIAAHGEFTRERATSGVVLGDIHLTANIFSKLAVVPDLVMLNACHLGRVTEEGPTLAGANRSAASVARVLVRLGVRAVVVAGWAVDDRAAEKFATTLYRDLLAGEDFGDAVATARVSAWRERTGSMTWGAYQCYGDPGFRLAPRTTRIEKAPVNTVGDLRRRVQQFTRGASDQGRSTAVDPEKTSDDLKRALGELMSKADDLKASDVLPDLAAAWAELFEFERAIELYLRALNEGGSSVPVRVLEQLGNLQIREARRRDRGGRSEGVDSYVTSARKWLRLALRTGTSGERLALLGSYHKKRAAMTAGDRRLKHLQLARSYYECANSSSPDPYHEFNVRQLAALIRLGNPNRHHDDSDRTPPAPPDSGNEENTDSEDRRPEPAPDFWKRAKEGDRLLTELLEEAAHRAQMASMQFGDADFCKDRVNEMVAKYTAAFRLRSSGRERASVIDHLDDLAELIPSEHPLSNALESASSQLLAWPHRQPRFIEGS